MNETIEVQTRVNDYFYLDVVPKLRECWSRVRGEGTVTIAYSYVREQTRAWVPRTLEVHASTLPAGQERVTLGCMREAVEGTSLPLGRGDGAANEFVLYWTWPVPLPADQVTLKKKKGCDGHGTPELCGECKIDEDWNLKCITVCVGWSKCEEPSPNTCSITLKRCASGGPFGFPGVLAR